MKSKIWRIGVALALLTSCAADPDDLVAPTTTVAVSLTGVTVRVRAIDNNFRPKSLEAKVGDLVEFSNGGRNDHDVTPSDKGAKWGVVLADFVPKATYSHVFTEPGVYEFYCTIHGTNKVGMVGSITVTK